MNKSHKNYRTLIYLGLPLSLCFALIGCSDKDKDSNSTGTPTATQKQQLTNSVDRLMQWPEKDLRDGARKAVAEQRWYKPTGNSALEYYLALKRKAKTPDESVDTALSDILPYAVIGMDQAVASFNDSEALRLEALIRMADPNHPSLARVKADLEKMKARQAQAETDSALADELKLENETKAKADAAKAKEEAAKKAKETAQETAQVITPVSVAPVAAPVAVAPAPEVVAPVPVAAAPTPAPAARADIVPIRTPQPDYPRDALIAGTKGEVVADIRINGAGDVTDVQIISATPRNVFNKSVISTVRKWKYRGNGENTTIRRTFVFN